MNIEQIYSSFAVKKKLVCPWQLAPIIDNRLRPLVHNPEKIFAPYVTKGMTVLDVGWGGPHITILEGGEPVETPNLPITQDMPSKEQVGVLPIETIGGEGGTRTPTPCGT